MLIIQTTETDVHKNLAVEEWLLENAPSVPVLFLYVNSPCVVIGKNQNPWRECRLSEMKTDGVPMARRISGGGAVVHDDGNLNVSVIVSRTSYDEQKQYELISRALKQFGINAEKLGKNSLAVCGKKFSGQAFCMRRDRVLHHGTLLVNSNLNRLRRYLGAEINEIETKAVASIPSPVENLSAVAPALTIKKLSAALIETFIEMYSAGKTPAFWSEQNFPSLDSLTEKNKSDEWLFSRTPRFTVQLNGETLHVENGRVINHPDSPWFHATLQAMSIVL